MATSRAAGFVLAAFLAFVLQAHGAHWDVLVADASTHRMPEVVRSRMLLQQGQVRQQAAELAAHAAALDEIRIVKAPETASNTAEASGSNASAPQQPAEQKHANVIQNADSQASAGPRKPLKVLTVAVPADHSVDSYNGSSLSGLEESVQAMIQAGVSLELVKCGEEDEKFVYFHSKARAILSKLRELPDEEVILCADAFDVLLLPCGRDLRDTFETFQADGVFQSAYSQYPDGYKESLFPEADEEGKPQDRKFILTGVSMWRAGALKYYLSQFYLRNGDVDSELWEDQRFWANMFLAQYYAPTSPAYKVTMPKLKIDYQGALFQQFISTMIWSQDPQTRYVKTATRYEMPACVLHAPGGPQNWRPMLEGLWPKYKAGEQMLHNGTQAPSDVSATATA